MSIQPFPTRLAFLEAAIERATPGRHRLEEFTFHVDYAEPGYDKPEKGCIVTGNFNEITRYDQGESTVLCDLPRRVARILEERYGDSLEWSDEWTVCDQCSKLIRTRPDSYSWKRYYAELDGEIVCGDCVAKDPEKYLKSLENEDTKAITFDHKSRAKKPRQRFANTFPRRISTTRLYTDLPPR